MYRGNSLGFTIAFGCFLLSMPWAMADDATPQPVAPSLPALKADTPPQLTDRNGVVLDAATPGLAYLRLSKSAGEQPLQLSLESKSNKILDEELTAGIEKYSAQAAAGFIMDVNTGEIIALSSIESENSQKQASASGGAPFNRVTQAVYEIGSSAKLMTIAMALDAGKVSMASRVDGSELHYGKFTIHDAIPQHRRPTLPNAMIYGSNIVAARLAQRVGTTGQKAFLEKMGQLDGLDINGTDRATPIVPEQWTGFQTVVTSFGQGFAVSPLQAGMAISAMVNGGTLLRPTIFKRSEQASGDAGQRVISSDTSAKMRYLLRLNAEEGMAQKANVAGYIVGGATSTGEKVVNDHYVSDRVLTTFTAVYPADKPKYLVMTIFDEPQALRETHGFITGAWNAAPVAAKVIERTAPILGVERRAMNPRLRSPV